MKTPVEKTIFTLCLAVFMMLVQAGSVSQDNPETPVIITPAFVDVDSTISGDILFMSDRNGKNQIYRAHFDTAQNDIYLSQLTTEEQAVDGYFFAPETQKITYLSGISILAMDTDGQNIELVKTITPIPGRVSTWYESDTIVFVAEVGKLVNSQASTCSVYGAYEYDLNSQEIDPLFNVEHENYQLQDDGTYYYDGLLPASRYCPSRANSYIPRDEVSHLGEKVAIIRHLSYFGASFGTEASIHDIKSEGQQVFPVPGEAQVIRWSPDDSYIIYETITGGRYSSIGIASSDGAVIHLLLSDERYNFANPYWLK